VGVGHHRCGPHCPRPSRQTGFSAASAPCQPGSV